MFLILANILTDFSLGLPNEDAGNLGTQYKVNIIAKTTFYLVFRCKIIFVCLERNRGPEESQAIPCCLHQQELAGSLGKNKFIFYSIPC